MFCTGPFALGDEGDFRVSDAGLHRDWSDRVWYDTAALVVEIVSPGDESWEKLEFYGAHRVEELLIVDPQEKSTRWLGLEAGEYKPWSKAG